MKYTALKGTKDVLPQESYAWHYVEQTIRKQCGLYGFQEIRTPVIEHTELFLRSVGDTTDVVQKEMYTFDDRGGRSITLKPEGTAGAVRAFIEHGLFNNPMPMKMYYLYCPVFRYEKPQAGRLREHHQFGVEVFGSPNAVTDAEVISLALSTLKKLGVQGLKLNINSIGCEHCRPQYTAALKEYFKPHLENMCHDCRQRYEKNPLRLLDCKEEACAAIAKDAPSMIQHLCPECTEHFEQLQAHLTDMGVDFAINPRIVRGLDYYTKTVFEIISTQIGSQGTVCGGGRYDKLLETCGGPSLPGIGFGMGMERLLLVMQAQGAAIPEPNVHDVYIITFGDARRALTLASALREEGIRAGFDPMGRGMKAQMRQAEKSGAKFTVLEGSDEREQGVVTIKNMADGTQETVALDSLTEYCKSRGI